jgi:hypothetical protein
MNLNGSRIPLLLCLISAILCLVSAIFLKGAAAQSTNPTTVPNKSLYAPYCYVDTATDSYMEVKSHVVKSPITLLPIITTLGGKRVKLSPITVPPLATVRVSLKSQLLKSHVPSPTSPGGKSRHWGDGSRPNSLVGAIQLDVISPQTATAKDFNGWILVENFSERLGTMSMFENPGGAIGTVLEGLWWTPYADAELYFALQNTTQTKVTVEFALFDKSGQLAAKSLTIPGFGARLINAREILGSQALPELGSATFMYNTSKPGAIVARGRLLQEKIGFSASWKLQEIATLTNVPAGTKSELHAPAAYFGKLNRLSHRGQAYLHPHLLLKNVSKRRITTEATVYGKDAKGKDTKLNIEPLILEPNFTVHIDLEQKRQERKGTLADGPAGVRLIYDGTPTEVVAELLSVDETGHVVFYDDVRSPFLYQATMQSAISFNLENDSQSFLIVKNTADKPRKPRMVLDYNEGRDHYNVDAAEIPPQQNVIVDIEHMRNAKTPDINGHTLPSDVKFGGSVIFSEPGAFVISDPTLAYGHTTTEGNDPVDEDPFFIFSCVRDTSPSDRGGGDGGGTLNMDLACDKAGMGCLLQGSPTPLCAILRCRKSYCNDHPCTRDERRKAYDANEYYNITNCDLFPCRQRPD